MKVRAADMAACISRGGKGVALIFLACVWAAVPTGRSIAEKAVEPAEQGVRGPTIETECLTDVLLQTDPGAGREVSRQSSWPAGLSGGLASPLGAEQDALPPLTLQELEKDVRTGPEVLVAVAELEESMSILEWEQARNGLRVFGSAGAGSFREPITDTKVRDYQRARVSVGLRYPLLGSRKQERLSLLNARARTWEKEQKIRLARRQSLAAVRAHYVNYWGSRRKIDLCRSFLTHERSVENTLEHRTRAGYLLDSDRREFLTAFAMVRRNAARANGVGERALGVLRLLTRPGLNPFTPVSPRLPEPCQDREALRRAVLESHPELHLLQALLQEQIETVRLSGQSDLQANVDLTGSASSDYPSGEDGYGVALNVSVGMPFKFYKARVAERSAALAAQRRTERELEWRRAELVAEAEESLTSYRVASENRRFATRRVEAALESMREKLLRSTYLSGDTLEKLQQGRLQYFQAAMDYIDAEIMELHAQARLLQYCPEACGTEVTGRRAEQAQGTPHHSMAPETSPGRYGRQSFSGSGQDAPGEGSSPSALLVKRCAGNGVYVWDSRQLLLRLERDPDVWKHFSDNGINRLLLSFDREQLDELQFTKARSRLREFIGHAARQDLQVELLLGEPLWILPEHRQDLLDIIRHVGDLPFTGLHLDLEPDQLDPEGSSRQDLLHQWVATLQAVKAASPWPIGLSIHPRYLDPGKSPVWMWRALEHLDVSEIVLMIYVANPGRVAELAAAILEHHRGLSFSIAQSMEPALSGEESYARQGREQFQIQMNALRNQMDQANFLTLVIQSWKDLTEAGS
jgi:hypothetical protein